VYPQASAGFAVSLVAEGVEKLGVEQCRNEVEARIGIGHDDKERRLAVADGVEV